MSLGTEREIRMRYIALNPLLNYGLVAFIMTHYFMHSKRDTTIFFFVFKILVEQIMQCESRLENIRKIETKIPKLLES